MFTRENARAWGQAGALKRWARASAKVRDAEAARLNDARNRHYIDQALVLAAEQGVTLTEREVTESAHRLMLAHLARARAIAADKKAGKAA